MHCSFISFKDVAFGREELLLTAALKKQGRTICFEPINFIQQRKVNEVEVFQIPLLFKSVIRCAQLTTTMRNIVFVLFLSLVFLVSCDGYEQSPTDADYVSSLNFEITKGQQNGAAWTYSPEEIARHFFPPVSHDSGRKRYEVSKKVKSVNNCIVTVVEEGVIDDEVLGERHTLQLYRDGKHWTITDAKLEIRRRQ